MSPASHRDALTGLMLGASVVLLGFGLFLPAFTIEKFFVFDSTKSIAGGVWSLLTERNMVLGMLVLAFSIVFPLAKLALAARIWIAEDVSSPRLRQLLSWTVWLGKWSMLDVFMVAIVIAMLSLGMAAEVVAHLGVYLFCAAILLSMWATHRLDVRVALAVGPRA